MRAVLLLSVLLGCQADLRMASQPKNGFKAKDRQRKPYDFKPDYALYMEPSDFDYAGLKKQRDGRGYDQFLRSNIDNEQDRRNFVTELGRDHLPFRTYEAGATDAKSKYKIPATTPGPTITATPGKEYTVPLRWNNPHASELEVNIWIMNTPKKYVVPIRKPTCSGEGYQDNVFDFVVPNDFNALGSKLPGFKGCKKLGDCVLQVYAHSVESRTYAIGSPLVVEGAVTGSTTTEVGVQDAKKDVGTNYKSLRPVCLSSSNKKLANIANAVPRRPRLVSDVFNHAYQNSDFSPYSGQQPDQISQNLQASAILKMTVGNRGELGKQYFALNRTARNMAKQLDKKARNLIRVYESITNQIIGAIGKNMTSNDTLSGGQITNKCFRCADVGSTSTRRLTTNTYVPSFEIPERLLSEASKYVAPMYAHLITQKTVGGPGVLQIYNAVIQDMNDDFLKVGKYGVHYLPAMLKDTLTTKADATKFRKLDANMQPDKYKGRYAAQLVQAEIKKNEMKVIANMASGAIPPGKNVINYICNKQPDASVGAVLDGSSSFFADPLPDMNGVMADGACDDDKVWTQQLEDEGKCGIPGANVMTAAQIFPDVGQVEAQEGYIPSPASSLASSWLFAVFCILVVALQ
jgi:hypothetical protein